MLTYLGLGANLGDRAGNLSSALELLDSKELMVRRISPVVESPALLPDDAPASEGEALAHDQRQNAEYTGMIERAADSPALWELATALHETRVSMESAARLLDSPPPSRAIPD